MTTLEWSLAAGILVAVLAMVAEGVVYVRADAAGRPASSREVSAAAQATSPANRSQVTGQVAKAVDAAAKADISTVGKEIATYYVDATVSLRSSDVTLAGGFFHVAGYQVGRASSVVRSIRYVPGAKATGDPLATWCVEVAYDGGTRPVVSYSAEMGLVLSACADQSAAPAAQETVPPQAPIRMTTSPSGIDEMAMSDVYVLGKEVATYFVDAEKPLRASDVAVVGGKYFVNGLDITSPRQPPSYAPKVLFVPGGSTVAQQSSHWCVQLTYTGGTRSVVSYSQQQGPLAAPCAQAS